MLGAVDPLPADADGNVFLAGGFNGSDTLGANHGDDDQQLVHAVASNPFALFAQHAAHCYSTSNPHMACRRTSPD
jgi:hypothetical protein